MNKKVEMLVERYNNSSVKDEVYGEMITVEELSEEFGFTIEESNRWYEVDEDTFLKVEFVQKKVALWIYLDCYDKADYEYLNTKYIEEMREDYKKYVEYMQELGDELLTFEEYAGI